MNTPQYEVVLKVRRLLAWASATNNAQVQRDLRAVEKTILALSEEIKSLKLSRHQLKTGRVPMAPHMNLGVMVTGTPEQQAEAVCAAEGEIDVYRFASGAITWRRRGGKAPKGGEFIGSYDEGADYRRVCEDLAGPYPLLAEVRRSEAA